MRTVCRSAHSRANAVGAAIPMAGERRWTVTVVTQAKAGVIRVADSGPAIAADVLPRIFEPFFTTREAGLGLGLSLCETLASGLGGGLTAEHNAPRGAVFRLSLPLVVSP